VVGSLVSAGIVVRWDSNGGIGACERCLLHEIGLVIIVISGSNNGSGVVLGGRISL